MITKLSEAHLIIMDMLKEYNDFLENFTRLYVQEIHES